LIFRIGRVFLVSKLITLAIEDPFSPPDAFNRMSLFVKTITFE